MLQIKRTLPVRIAIKFRIKAREYFLNHITYDITSHRQTDTHTQSNTVVCVPTCSITLSHTNHWFTTEPIFKMSPGDIFFSAFRNSIKIGWCGDLGCGDGCVRVYVRVWAQAGNAASVITEHLSQTQIVTNLLRLQNTTFQTHSHSKYSPVIPRLILKASLFSLSLSSHHKSQNLEQ